MTPEQKREQTLKRVLPALAIGVLYFGFVASRISGPAAQAEKEAETIEARGIWPGALESLQQQAQQTSGEASRIRGELAEKNKVWTESTGFLRDPDYGRDLGYRVTTLLGERGLTVLDEERPQQDCDKDLPRLVREFASRLRQTEKPLTCTLWRGRFTGSFAAAHGALAALTRDPVPLVPVALTMQKDDTDPTRLIWALSLLTNVSSKP
ncbi:MAG: hypothetical protein FJ189_03400 [Gammaproteobacteria bacterium]|nr:hypothetical protein [Gammaproteobacteria bacterium]